MRFYTKYLIRRNKTRKDGATPIYIRLSLKQKRVELSTGIFVHAHDWDDVKQTILPRSFGSVTYNQQLQKITSDINDVYNQLVSSGKPFEINDIKDRYLGTGNSRGVLNVFDYYLNTMETKLGKGYGYDTLRHYKVTYRKLIEFIKTQYSCKDWPVSNINYDFLNKFDMFIKSGYGMKQNTAWNYHKHLKRVLNIAVSLDEIAKNPYSKFRVLKEETNREFLTKEELTRLEGKEIDLIRLASVRDIFVFACYTGLSYSDISKLSKAHIHHRDDGNQWIIINRTKTKTQCMIPLFPNAIEILNSYSDYPETLLKGRVLPVLSNQKLNSYLKELAAICHISKNLSMHIARHTFATTVTLSNGVPIETVSKLLGHKSLKITQVYAKVLEGKISEDMMVLKKKLGM